MCFLYAFELIKVLEMQSLCCIHFITDKVTVCFYCAIHFLKVQYFYTMTLVLIKRLWRCLFISVCRGGEGVRWQSTANRDTLLVMILYFSTN
jgi:hypothetical protein